MTAQVARFPFLWNRCTNVTPMLWLSRTPETRVIMLGPLPRIMTRVPHLLAKLILMLPTCMTCIPLLLSDLLCMATIRLVVPLTWTLIAPGRTLALILPGAKSQLRLWLAVTVKELWTWALLVEKFTTLFSRVWLALRLRQAPVKELQRAKLVCPSGGVTTPRVRKVTTLVFVARESEGLTTPGFRILKISTNVTGRYLR